jgi:hypothetical protein
VLAELHGERLPSLVDLAFPERLCARRATVHPTVRTVRGLLLSRHAFGLHDGRERLLALQLYARNEGERRPVAVDAIRLDDRALKVRRPKAK